MTRLPDDLAVGVATSATQIEGAVHEGGRGQSIWDRFAHTPGKVTGGDVPDVACDHYHRWNEDLDLLAALGVDAYRFSIGWPRVFPSGGEAEPNRAGLDFYDRLVDGLLARGIAPWVTLYHWDLPQPLQDQGGWTARATVAAFERLTEVVARRLGDRVRDWNTINEPWCVSVLGYENGAHAPGLADRSAALAAAHHLLLAHGRAVPILREHSPGGRVGVVVNLVAPYPASSSEHDARATERFHAWFNQWFLDPLYGRGYPALIVDEERAAGRWPGDGPDWLVPGDLDVIATPTDLLGVNYYSRAVLRGPEEGNLPRTVFESDDRTEMGWEVHPQGLQDILETVWRDYRPGSLAVTECGAAFADRMSADGGVHDPRRIDFLDGHLAAAVRARSGGVPLGAFFVWTLMDNFEWNEGYAKRFGLVWVDHDSQRRVIKDSGRWLAERLAERGSTA